MQKIGTLVVGGALIIAGLYLIQTAYTFKVGAPYVLTMGAAAITLICGAVVFFGGLVDK